MEGKMEGSVDEYPCFLRVEACWCVVETPVPCMGEEGMKPKREKRH